MGSVDAQLPTFIIIGSMKSGTTGLFNTLNQHPDIYGSPRKEPQFFSDDGQWARGVDWYRDLFADGSSYAARGEASSGYTKFPSFPDTAKRMHSIVPDAKLIYLVRDPIDRMVSHYRHNVIDGYENRTIDEALSNLDAYIHLSKYATQLDRYLAYFNRDQILVVHTEVLRSDPDATLDRIATFIGVSPQQIRATDVSQANVTSERRQLRPGITRLAHTATWRRLRGAAPAGLRTAIGRLTRGGAPPAEAPSPDVVQMLTSALQPEIDRLSAEFGPVPRSWSVS